MRDKIIEILEKNEVKNEDQNWVYSSDYEAVANEILSLHNDLVQEAVEDLQGLELLND